MANSNASESQQCVCVFFFPPHSNIQSWSRLLEPNRSKTLFFFFSMAVQVITVWTTYIRSRTRLQPN